MLLRATLTSPFGRKARLAALRLGLADRIKVVDADPLNAEDPLRKDNPLGKIPALILDNGQAVFDSRVILEYLDHLAGGGKIIPTDFDARIKALTTQALADGVMDAGVLIVYESRHRPAEIHHKPWLDYQRGKVERSLAALAANPPDPTRFDVASLTTACAIGYIDWRKQVDWRANYPALVAWLDAFRAATPEFDQTRPPV